LSPSVCSLQVLYFFRGVFTSKHLVAVRVASKLTDDIGMLFSVVNVDLKTHLSVGLLQHLLVQRREQLDTFLCDFDVLRVHVSG